MTKPVPNWVLVQMGAPDWVLALSVGLLALMGRESSGLTMKHPMRGIVDRVNENGGPYYGLVMAYPTEEIALQESGFFVPSSDTPSVNLSGRTFHIGTIGSVDVIYVMTGEQILNAGITVQILLDTFDIEGVVHYGTAGSANDSLSLADVSVLEYASLTGSWKWEEFDSDVGELAFGDFNFPSRGENLLASVQFTPTQVYSPGKDMEELFWIPSDSNWFNISSELQDLELESCINETYCLSETPKVVHGLRGSTADIFLDNAAYRQFLFTQFNVSTVDEESGAILMTCLSNDVPCIVFRGVSDLAGGTTGNLSDTSLSSLASVNALTVAIKFIELTLVDDLRKHCKEEEQLIDLFVLDEKNTNKNKPPRLTMMITDKELRERGSLLGPPEHIRAKMEALGGVEPVLVITKFVTRTDISKQHAHLSLPSDQLEEELARDTRFLRESEWARVNAEAGDVVKAMLVGPKCSEPTEVSLKSWSSPKWLAIATGWDGFLAKYDKQHRGLFDLNEADQVWAARCNGGRDVLLALVVVGYAIDTTLRL